MLRVNRYKAGRMLLKP